MSAMLAADAPPIPTVHVARTCEAVREAFGPSTEVVPEWVMDPLGAGPVLCYDVFVPSLAAVPAAEAQRQRGVFLSTYRALPREGAMPVLRWRYGARPLR